MYPVTRRDFLRTGVTGLAAGAGALLLRPGVAATEESGDLGAYGDYLRDRKERPGTPAPQPAPEWHATEDNILGPFYREKAPYRAKVTPPLEPGTVLLVRGKVWALDTRKPLAGALLDVWQANATGRYDNDDPRNPPKEGVFLNRARLVAGEEGAYEFETIHPGRYRIGRDVWRPSHIHYLVRHPGYRTLVTQLYFRGDPMNGRDDFIRASLVMDVESVRAAAGSYERMAFDIVLAPEK